MAAGGGGSKKSGNDKSKDPNSKDKSGGGLGPRDTSSAQGGGLGRSRGGAPCASKSSGNKDTSKAPGGGTGRSRGGTTGDSTTAQKNRDALGVKDPSRHGKPGDEAVEDTPFGIFKDVLMGAMPFGGIASIAGDIMGDKVNDIQQVQVQPT
ncbi:MAG: hypothetical protein HYU58_09015 [Proteobacteria bacterium]|nr:hypothetical protein [Pseudomonadota bacterium]